MKGKITRIPADETIAPSEIAVEGSGEVILPALQGIVDGYIELVPYFHKWHGERCAAFCNEDGKRMRLPVNVRATEIWWTMFRTSDVLVGDVAIVTGDEEFFREL